MPQARSTCSITSGIERLAGADQFAQRRLPGAQVFLDHHAPHGGRRAQRGHAAAADHVQAGARREALVVVDEDGGAGIPGREEAAPRMLGPAGRADVPVDVALLQADPVHGRQVADRVALLAVQHQLRFRGGAGGEVQQQRVGGARHAVGREPGSALLLSAKVAPPLGSARIPASYRDAGVVAGQRLRTCGPRRPARSRGGYGRAAGGLRGRRARPASWSAPAPRPA
jgi:hypothetical protein